MKFRTLVIGFWTPVVMKFRDFKSEKSYPEAV